MSTSDPFTIENAIRESWIPRNPEDLSPSVIQDNVKAMLKYRGFAMETSDADADAQFEVFAPCVYFSYSPSSACAEWHRKDEQKDEKGNVKPIKGVVFFVGSAVSTKRIKIATVRNVVQTALQHCFSHIIIIGKQVNKKNQDAVVAEQQSKIRLELFASEFFEVNLFANIEFVTLQPILLTFEEMKAKTFSSDSFNVGSTDVYRTDPSVEYVGGISGQFIQLRQARIDGAGVYIEFARIVNEQKEHDTVTITPSAVVPTPGALVPLAPQ